MLADKQVRLSKPTRNPSPDPKKAKLSPVRPDTFTDPRAKQVVYQAILKLIDKPTGPATGLTLAGTLPPPPGGSALVALANPNFPAIKRPPSVAAKQTTLNFGARPLGISRKQPTSERVSKVAKKIHSEALPNHTLGSPTL